MRILLIEDEKKLATALKEGFEQEGWAVDWAADGEEGLDLALSEDYDVLVLDLLLPKIDGREICRRFRKKNTDTPILMLTALADVSDRVEGLNAGADDYLAKPFAFAELLARIRALYRRRSPQSAIILQVGDLKLDSVNFLVTRAGQKISLSKKEFALLEFLMRHRGQVVGKEKIMEHLWDFAADILPNTLEATVANLRKKIDKPFSKKLIQTVRGFGYKITTDV